jgi:flavin-dependent dehydrogenase
VTSRWDVAIAGAGPAGLALAIELARTTPLRIVVVDAATRRRMRFGETLSPDARPLLTRLGIGAAFASGAHAICQGTIAAWGSDTAHYTDFLFHPAGHGWRVDRECLDVALAAEACRHGVERIDGQIGALRRSDDEWHLDGDTPLRARMLVDATGRSASIARRLGAQRIGADSLVGVAGVFEGMAPEAGEERWAIIESRRDGWGYSAVMPDGRVAVVAMTDSDLAHAARLHDPTTWRAWIDALPRTARRIAGATLAEGPAVASAASHRLDEPGGEGWLAIGDAASSFDPLSSQGITKALRSGIRAASVIRDSLAGDMQAIAKYGEEVAAEYAVYLAARTAYYAMEQRWSTSPFWQRRAAGV